MKQELYEVKGETLIVHLPEELDHHSAGMIREGTDELFTCKKIRNVIFDYKNTSFMDSSGIGLIMGRYREVRYLSGNVYLVEINEKMDRILKISGLYRVAKKTDSVDEALRCIEKNETLKC